MLQLERVPLPISPKRPANDGYGSAILGLGDGSFVTSWIEGTASFRLARVHATTGASTVLKGIRGLLRDAVVEASQGRAWLLCTHGMYEVSLEPFEILRTLNKGLGDYCLHAVPFDEDLIACSKRHGRSATLVSRSELSVVGRVSLPEPELALRTSRGVVVVSPSVGEVRVLDEKRRTVGKPVKIPEGFSPIAAGGAVYYLPGDPVAPAISPAPGPDFDVERYSRIAAEGSLARLDLESLSVSALGQETGFRTLHAVDAQDRVLGSSWDFQHDGRRFFLRRADGTLLASAEVASRIGAVGRFGEQAVVVRHVERRQVLPEVSVLRWS